MINSGCLFFDFRRISWTRYTRRLMLKVVMRLIMLLLVASLAITFTRVLLSMMKVLNWLDVLLQEIGMEAVMRSRMEVVRSSLDIFFNSA